MKTGLALALAVAVLVVPPAARTENEIGWTENIATITARAALFSTESACPA
jgi:hypothetical protein